MDMALDMRDSVKFVHDPRPEFDGDESAHIGIRLGSHSGPVVAGIVGFNVKEENNPRTKEAKTSIQAKHAWALLLDQDSVFRKKEDSFSR